MRWHYANQYKRICLETLIVDWLVNHNSYEQGTNADYNCDYAIDETCSFRFLQFVDSVIVVTDWVVLDKQIRDNIKQFMQVSNTVAWAEHSSDLRKAIQAGKRIIITTMEKFPFVLSDIGT